MPAAEQSVGTIATAEVDVRAKLDNLDRDLQSAFQKVGKFDQSMGNATRNVRRFEGDSNLAAAAMTSFGFAIGKAEQGMKALEQTDQKVVGMIKNVTAAN